jgi:hypothetical protein
MDRVTVTADVNRLLAIALVYPCLLIFYTHCLSLKLSLKFNLKPAAS